MSRDTESPAPPIRGIAYEEQGKAYQFGPLHGSEAAIRGSFHRIGGQLFRAAVLLIALAMLLPMEIGRAHV